MAAPFNFERRREASDERDRQAAYISRREAAPLTQPISRRAHVNHLIFSADGTRFPGEPHLKILPDIDACLPGGKCGKDPDPGVSKQVTRNALFDKEMHKKLDIFGAFSPKRKGKIPGRF